jgi:hypothetical protein
MLRVQSAQRVSRLQSGLVSGGLGFSSLVAVSGAPRPERSTGVPPAERFRSWDGVAF